LVGVLIFAFPENCREMVGEMVGERKVGIAGPAGNSEKPMQRHVALAWNESIANAPTAK
jgi:hypothetical protein